MHFIEVYVWCFADRSLLFRDYSHKFMAGEEAEVNIVGCKNIFTQLFSLEFESPRKMRFQCGCGVHSSLLLNCGVDEILMVG